MHEIFFGVGMMPALAHEENFLWSRMQFEKVHAYDGQPPNPVMRTPNVIFNSLSFSSVLENWEMKEKLAY